MSATLQIEADGSIIRIVLPGPNIDRGSLQTMEDQMLAMIKHTPSPRVVVDFSNVEFMPTVGLGTLIALQKWARERGGEMRIASLRGRVLELFHISRLDRIFDIYETTDGAVAGLGL